MDVALLLRTARDRAGLSQRALAAAAATSQGAISAYENGSRSPTSSTLERLLAACGLQLRADLQLFMADVDARLDAALATGSGWGRGGGSASARSSTAGSGPGACPAVAGEGEPGRQGLDVATVRTAMRSLDLLDPVPVDGPAYLRMERRGAVPWALDGASALTVQGLGLVHRAPELAVAVGEELRWWLRAIRVQPETPDGRVDSRGWLSQPLVRFAELVDGRSLFTSVGNIVLRVVPVLPGTVTVLIEDGDGPLTVRALTVDEVERGHRSYSELLARWRQRRTVSG